MSMFRNNLGVDATEPADNYISPNKEEIDMLASKFELKNKPYYSIVKDMANLASGGKFKEPDQLQSQIRATAMKSMMKQAAQLGENRDWAQKQANGITTREMSFMSRLRDFLQDLHVNYAPGKTPLEKSVGILKAMEESQNMNSESMNKGIQLFRNLDTEDRELMDYEEDPDENPGQFADFMSCNMSEIVKISRHLDKISALRVYRLNEATVDPEGDEVRYRPMISMDEMQKMHSSEWALPESFRLYKHVTQQTPVREHIIRTEKKQLIYMVVDSSGSMSWEDRFKFALGALYNRVKAVARGDAEMWFRWFTHEVHPEYHIHNKETAKRALQEAILGRRPDGGTQIDQALNVVSTRIRELMEENPLHRPEIVIVSDGDDQIQSTSADLQGIRLHSFTCQGENPGLNQLARSTGGVGMYLDWNTIRR